MWKDFHDEIKKFFTFFIIDDCSKILINDLLKDEDLSDIDINLYRVTKDLYCNIAGVRNLGAKECKTAYIVILDMDTIIDNKLVESLVIIAKDNINKNNVFKFNRIVPNNPNHIKNNTQHPAICLIRQKDYWNIGGCEEDLVGHYRFTDPSFWYRSTGKVNIIYRSDLYLIYFPEGEADIDRDTKHNGKLYKKKCKNNNWSTDFIRFPWLKIQL